MSMKAPPALQAAQVDSRASTPEELYITEKKPKKYRAFSTVKMAGEPTPKKREMPRSRSFSRRMSMSSMSDKGKGKEETKPDDDDENSSARMKFPTYEELQLLPEEIRDTLMSLVIDFMKKMFYPRLALLSRRRQKKNAVFAATPTTPTVGVQFLQQIPFFSRWNNLEGLISGLELQLYERDEIVVMQGDPTQSGIYFLVQGTISVRKYKTFPDGIIPPKGVSDRVTQQIRSVEPPHCFGERVFLTEEPRMETLRTTSRCAIWVLKKDVFFRYFDQLPDDRRRAVLESAYERRREIMPTVFPLTAEVLADAPLYSSTPLENLASLAAKAEPRVYPKNSHICRIGDSGSEMYYIARGDIELAMAAVEGEPPIISKVEAGTIVGEMGVFSTKKRNLSLYCRSTSDVYAMDHEMISSSINNQAVMGRILQKAHALQAAFQSHTKRHHSEWISAIPFINRLGNPKLVAALLSACDGNVYPLHSTIISVSECCDRLVLITRGKARISSGSTDLRIGEALGFSCLVPHRWAYHVVAAETVESLELPFKTFSKILKQFDLYEEVKSLTLGLLYPRVHPEQFQRAIDMARHYVNPPCFPTSMEFDPKPFAARVAKQVTVASPKKRKPIDRLRNSTPTKLAPINSAQVAEANAFFEELDRRWGRADADGQQLTEEEEKLQKEREEAEARIRREKAITRKRLTAGKDQKLLRTRNADEMSRLSNRIRELQRQQAASVPLSHHSSKRRARSSSVAPSESPSDAESAASPSPDRQKKTQPPLAVIPTSRTIATQTVKSYLQAKAQKAERNKPILDPSPSVMNDD